MYVRYVVGCALRKKIWLQVLLMLVTRETLRASRFVDLCFSRLLFSSDDRHLSSLITCSVNVCYDYYELNN
jgi:hypothetical protein